MISSLTVAKYFIIRTDEDGRENLMTHIKVQKLLYYTSPEINIFVEYIKLPA